MHLRLRIRVLAHRRASPDTLAHRASKHVTLDHLLLTDYLDFWPPGRERKVNELHLVRLPLLQAIEKPSKLGHCYEITHPQPLGGSLGSEEGPVSGRICGVVSAGVCCSMSGKDKVHSYNRTTRLV